MSEMTREPSEHICFLTFGLCLKLNGLWINKAVRRDNKRALFFDEVPEHVQRSNRSLNRLLFTTDSSKTFEKLC